jgi:hypothetical protein
VAAAQFYASCKFGKYDRLSVGLARARVGFTWRGQRFLVEAIQAGHSRDHFVSALRWGGYFRRLRAKLGSPGGHHRCRPLARRSQKTQKRDSAALELNKIGSPLLN